MEKIISDLKHELDQYRQLRIYKLNKSSKANIAIIYIAIYLTELGLYMNREITQAERVWFEADQILLREFDHQEAGDIFKNYLHLKREVSNNKFFNTQK